MTQAADTAANANWLERWSVRIAEAIASAVAAVMLSVANFCFGFLWGDPISEDYGGKWWAFAGDVVAGLLIFGDIRDLFKWGIWKPFVMGEGWTWENTLNIVMALIGLIPIIGDLRKGKKGFDLLIKTTRKTLVTKLGDKLAERLIGELGEEAALELAEKLGKEAIEKLLKSLDGKALKALSDELGPELLKKLAADLEGSAIKKLATELGPDTIKSLLKELDPKALFNVAGTLDAATLKEIAGSADGPKVLRELLETTDRETLRKLVGDLGSPTHRTADALGQGPSASCWPASPAAKSSTSKTASAGSSSAASSTRSAPTASRRPTEVGKDLLAELTENVTSKQLRCSPGSAPPRQALPGLPLKIWPPWSSATARTRSRPSSRTRTNAQRDHPEPVQGPGRQVPALLPGVREGPHPHADRRHGHRRPVRGGGRRRHGRHQRDARQMPRRRSVRTPVQEVRAGAAARGVAEVPHADWLEMQTSEAAVGSE